MDGKLNDWDESERILCTKFWEKKDSSFLLSLHLSLTRFQFETLSNFSITRPSWARPVLSPAPVDVHSPFCISSHSALFTGDGADDHDVDDYDECLLVQEYSKNVVVVNHNNNNLHKILSRKRTDENKNCLSKN